MSSSKTKHIKRKLFHGALHGYHRGKDASKFQFDILFKKIHGGASSEYVLRWTKGAKYLSTEPFKAEPHCKDGVVLGQSLSMMCTLYRPKGSNDKFDEKDTKISLVSQKEGEYMGKTVGKAHFNLSDYAGVPSRTTESVFELNTKARLDVKITATFVGNVEGGPSSVATDVSQLTGSSEFPETGEQDEGSDLGLNDSITPEDSAVPSPVTEADSQKSSFGVLSIASGQKCDPSSPCIPDTSRDSCHSEPQSTAPRTSTPKSGALLAKIKASRKSSDHLLNIRSHFSSQGSKKQEPEATTTSETILDNKSDGKHVASLMESKHEEQEKVASENRKLLRTIEELQEESKRAIANKNDTIDLLENRISSLNTQISLFQKSKARLESENDTIKKQLEELKTPECRGKATDESISKESKACSDTESRSQVSHTTSAKIADQEKTIAELTDRCANLERECSETHATVTAHKEHADKIKVTFDNLSDMYERLRQEYASMQAEVKDALEETLTNSPNPERNRFKKFFRPEKRSPANDVVKSGVQELRDLKVLAQEANLKLIECEQEKLLAEKNVAILTEELSSCKQKIDQTKLHVEQRDGTIESIKAQLLEKDEALETEKGGKSALQASFEKLREEFATREQLHQQLNTAQEAKLKLAGESTENLNATISKLKADLSSVSEKLSIAASTEIQRENCTDAMKKDLERLHEILESKEHEISALSEELSSRDDPRQKENDEKLIQILQRRIDEQKREIDSLREKVQQFQQVKEMAVPKASSDDSTAKDDLLLSGNQELRGLREQQHNSGQDECGPSRFNMENSARAVLQPTRHIAKRVNNNDAVSSSVVACQQGYAGNHGKPEKRPVPAEKSRREESTGECNDCSPQSHPPVQTSICRSATGQRLTKNTEIVAEYDTLSRESRSSKLGDYSDDSSLSSSQIRRENLVEKITDLKILDMLIETKVKLAVAQEEKVR